MGGVGRQKRLIFYQCKKWLTVWSDLENVQMVEGGWAATQFKRLCNKLLRLASLHNNHLILRSSKSRGVKSDGWAVEDSAASQSRDMRPACNVLISSLTYTPELELNSSYIHCICGESYFWFGLESGHWTILYWIVWYLWFHLVWFSKCLEGTGILYLVVFGSW